MSEKKYYALGATSEEAWGRIHKVMMQDGSLDDNIPSRPVECADLIEHSPTRAVYLLTDEEAELVSQHPDIVFIHLNQENYPELFPPAPDELHCVNDRYSSGVKNYRGTGFVPYSTPVNSAELNRAGFQVLRSTAYADPWNGSLFPITSNTVPRTTSLTGKHVDLIVGDEGCWFGHAEFANNIGTGPQDYVGGNVLPGNGTCDLLDVVLDGPYYIDPDWFNADPGSRLMTRWDGTIVPVESVARAWWTNSTQRSSKFASAGTVNIPSYYTRDNCNGSNTTAPPTGEGVHGTCCAGQAYGRTYGAAYNANKWFIDAYGTYGLWPGMNRYFDVMKIFHQNKPINPLYGTKDPTISSNSWGFRASIPSTGYYYFRQGTSGSGGVAYSVKPQFMYWIGYYGDGGRCKGEMLPSTITTAGDELIASGVIFVAAAGNSNQKQTGSDQPDYNNYWSLIGATEPLENSVHSEFGSMCYNTTNRRGFPQQIGKYTSGGKVVYPVINIGALDYNYDTSSGTKERKVNYSDMGDEIDCYAPGDNTLTSSKNQSEAYSPFPRYDQRPGGTTSWDTSFNGTSSACPTATGVIATALEANRSWGWQDVRTWIKGLTEQSVDKFYVGPDPYYAEDPNWGTVNALMGSARRVLYSNIPTGPVSVVNISGSLIFSGPITLNIA